MWPFSSRNKTAPTPTIRVGEISIRWNTEWEWWEFSDGDYEYSLVDNPEFDVGVLKKLDMAKRWLLELDREIDAEIGTQVEELCDWTGEKEVVGIDVSELMSANRIDVCYIDGDDWGDLGVNIVITDGQVTHSYAGD